MNKRSTIAVVVALAVVSGGLLAWRFGYVPEIGRFFAAEPGQPSTAGLMADLQEGGCLTNGLLWSSDVNVARFIEDDYGPLLGRLPCRYLSHAVETWLAPADFSRVRENIDRLERASGTSFTYGMFIAEWMPKTFRDGAMCSPTPLAGIYGADGCEVSVSQPEYRQYLVEAMSDAIDTGIRVFLFGQVYLQDSSWRQATADAPSPIAGVLKEVRAYAAQKGVPILIGAGTNHITNEFYLRQFDFVNGGLFFEADGTMAWDSPCRGGGTPNPDSTHTWGDCAAHQWVDPYRSLANHVQIQVDFESSLDDDMHKFASMGRAERATFLLDARERLRAAGASFLVPVIEPVAGPRTAQHCYGIYPWVYAASDAGSDHHDEFNDSATYPPGPYSCQDEKAVIAVFAGETQPSSPPPSPSPTLSPSPTTSVSPLPTASTVVRKPGDADGNGKVDIFDYNAVVSTFGRSGSNLAGDVDRDGKVDIFDYNAVVGNFGK